MPPTVVLLAFDGVLADTENYHAAAWQRTFARLGWDVPDEVAARAVDRDDYTFAVEVFARRGVAQADLDGWVARKRALMLEMVRHSPRLFPGAVELVRGLSGRVRLGVTAESRRDVVDAVLGRFGLLDAFELIVADDDAPAPRPDAARLTLAMKRLRPRRKPGSKSKAKPDDGGDGTVVALEWTLDGLRAARAAGASAVVVGHRRPFGDWVGDAPYVSGLEPASGLLARLGLGGD
jgi:beta-phosphoglucomutase-like phosphatase (HAD superfamily)